MSINPAALTNQQLVAAIYIGYYDRAPDPVGSAFWEQAAANPNISLQEIATLFSTQQETLIEYPFFSNPQPSTANDFIVELYLNLFNRAPDAEGLLFWSGVLQGSIAGESEISVGQIVIEIILGAQNVTGGTQDLSTIQNKIAVATAWTDAAEAAGLTGSSDYTESSALQESAKSILNQVTSEFSSVITAQAVTQDLFDAASGEFAAIAAQTAAASAAAAQAAYEVAESLKATVAEIATAQAYKAAADVAKAAADKAVADAEAASAAAADFATAAQLTDSTFDGEEASSAVASAAVALEAIKALQTVTAANAISAAEAVVALTPATPAIPSVPTTQPEAQIAAESAAEKAAASLAAANGAQSAADVLEQAVENLDTAVAYKAGANVAKSIADAALADAQAAASAAAVFAGFAAATATLDDGDIAAAIVARAASILADAQAAATAAAAEFDNALAAVAGESPEQREFAEKAYSEAEKAFSEAKSAYDEALTEASVEDLVSAEKFVQDAGTVLEKAAMAVQLAIAAQGAAGDFKTAADASESEDDDLAAGLAEIDATLTKSAADLLSRDASMRLENAKDLRDLSLAAYNDEVKASREITDAQIAIRNADGAISGVTESLTAVIDKASADEYLAEAIDAQKLVLGDVSAPGAKGLAATAKGSAQAAVDSAKLSLGTADDMEANETFETADSAFRSAVKSEQDAADAVAMAEAIVDAYVAIDKADSALNAPFVEGAEQQSAAALLKIAQDEKAAADVLEAALTPDINVDELEEAQAYLAKAVFAQGAAVDALDQANAALDAANDAAVAAAATVGFTNDDGAAQELKDAAVKAVEDAEAAVAIARAEVSDAELAVFENSSNTFFLTTTEDEIDGGSAADTFVAPLIGANGTAFIGIYGERSIQTLGHPDVLDGGLGIDSLEATLRFDYDGQFGLQDEPEPKLTSIENIFLTSVQDTAALSLENAEGVEQVWSQGSLNDLRVVDVQNLVTFGMRNVEEGTTFTVEYDPIAHLEGDNFAQALVLDGVGNVVEDVDFVLTVGAGSDAVVNELNITATGENYIDINLSDDGGYLEAITVSGDEGGVLVFTDIDGGDVGDVVSLDATGYTGDLTIDLEKASDDNDSLRSAKLGSGDDHLTVHGNALAAKNSNLLLTNFLPDLSDDVVLDGGDGDDVLVVNGISTLDFTNVSNFEQLVLQDTDFPFAGEDSDSEYRDIIPLGGGFPELDLSDTDFTSLVIENNVYLDGDFTLTGSEDFTSIEVKGELFGGQNAFNLVGFETLDLTIGGDFFDLELGESLPSTPFLKTDVVDVKLSNFNLVGDDLVTATLNLGDDALVYVGSLNADNLETLTVNLGEGSGFAGPIAGSANALTTVTINGDNALAATLFFGKEEESLETIDLSATDASVVVGFEAPISQELTVKVGEGNLYYGFVDTSTAVKDSSPTPGPDGELNLETALSYISGNQTVDSTNLDAQDLVTQNSDETETFQFLGADIGIVWISEFDTNVGETGDILDFSAFSDMTWNDLRIIYNEDLLGDSTGGGGRTDDVGTYITSDFFDGYILLLGVDATDTDHSYNFEIV